VVSHDCQLEKEFNDRVRMLVEEGRSEAEAEAVADGDPTLDQFINVCPLIDPSCYRATWDSLSAGKVIGAFPVPGQEDRRISPSVVDLTFRATIDRNVVVARFASLSEDARAHLRYAIARTDVFRNPNVTAELERAVGKEITSVKRSKAEPLVVVLTLSDGTTAELVMRPAPVDTTGPQRRLPPSDRRKSS
jgi:hypothetical protein